MGVQRAQRVVVVWVLRSDEEGDKEEEEAGWKMGRNSRKEWEGRGG